MSYPISFEQIVDDYLSQSLAQGAPSMATTNTAPVQPETTKEREAPNAGRVKVHLKRDASNSRSLIITVYHNGSKVMHNLNSSDLTPYLPAPWRKSVQNYPGYSLHDFFYYTSTIPLEVFANAIGAAYLATKHNPNMEKECEVELDRIMEGGYVSLGDYIFKMSPVAIARGPKALAIMRHQHTLRAKEQADSILADARQIEQQLLTKIQTRREELATLQKNIATAPTWAVQNNLPLRYQHMNKRWCVGMYVEFNITHFTFEGLIQSQHLRRTWSAKIGKGPIKRLIWLPLLDSNGSYNATNMYIDASHGVLPHMDRSKACQGPGTAPKLIDTYEHYTQLLEGIHTTHAVVVLNSLLSPLQHWPDDVKSYCPDVLLHELYRTDSDTSWGSRIMAPNFNKQGKASQTTNPTSPSGPAPADAVPAEQTTITVNVTQESTETWHA